MTIKLARDLPEKPFNTTINRFDSKYWTIDYNALMVGTILQIDERGFKIPAQWRTNSDFMGVRWVSEDTFDHEYFRYATDNNYRDTVLAFRSNPAEPHKFTATIVDGDVPLTYRLVPYALNLATNRYEPLDPDYNTGRTYPIGIIRPQAEWTPIPDEEMAPYKGRRDYIYIIDFSDMRMFSRFNGPRIAAENIASISFDTVELSHGLGKDAMVQSMEQIGDRVKVTITGATPGAVLTPGDNLSVLGKFRTKTGAVAGSNGWGSGVEQDPKFVYYNQGSWPVRRWPGSESKTIQALFTSPVMQEMAPLDDTVRPTVDLQIFKSFKGADDGNDNFEYWEIRTNTGPLPVTAIEQLSFSGTQAVFRITFDTRGTRLETDLDDAIKINDGKQYEWIEYWTLTYPAYEITTQEMQFTVEEWSGFGTGQLTVWYTGDLVGGFVSCETFYSRYLQTPAPVQVVDTIKYYVDMTTTGARRTLRAKSYPQPAHSLMMTSGFDDGYNLTPARQVDMVHALGYRGFWTKYLGMSHYFNGRTAYQDKVTGEIVPIQGANLDVSVMFAGDHSASAHFTQGLQPYRGADAFQQKAGELFGVAPGQVVIVNGTTPSSAADRAAALYPEDPVYDPSAGLTGGLWWWDLEADEPGPALRNCVNMADPSAPPVAVVWACAQQDYQAIASPGDRSPRPTVSRTIEATRRVISYIRGKWGSAVPVLLQGTGWTWGTDSVAAEAGTPMYLGCSRNGWGDVVFTWLAYQEDPADVTYEIQIFDPNNPLQILRRYDVPGSNVHGGLITFDWTVELNVEPAVEVFGDQFPWAYVKWRVLRKVPDIESVYWPFSKMMEMNVPVDNAGIVKKMCIMGINSLIGGYFNDLSDPLNPGGTGNPGRKDVVAASTFRRTLAQNAGLRDVEVMPVMTVVGSSPINPMPYQPGFPEDNYWWNPDTNQPGPNLIMADEIVRELGMPPSIFTESGPGETTGINFAPIEEKPLVLERFRTSNIAMLAWMRENWGNPELQIWFQGATTSFWGDPPPAETNAEGTQLLRDVQTSMSKEGIGFKMGSYVPNSNLYTTYRNEMAEGLGWIHYTVEGYHAAAAEMGEAIALDINRAYDEPIWAQLRQPKDLVPVQAADDIRFQWTARPGYNTFYYRNLRGDNGAVISQGVITGPQLVFTAAQQIAAYGQLATYVVFEVSEYVLDTAGPTARYVGAPVADADLLPVANLLATKQLNDDVTLTWDVRSGYNSFYYRNLRADNAAVISQGVITGGSYNFDRAAQVAEYGFSVLYTHFQIAEYDPVDGTTGPFVEWNGDAQTPVSPLNPITGFAATFAGAAGFSDVNMTWNASAVPGRKYRVINKRVDTLAVISNTIVSSPAFTFTTAQQTAEYGYTVGYIAVDVMEHDDAANLDGPVYSFNGAPS